MSRAWAQAWGEGCWGALLPLGKNELPAASSFSEELVSVEQASRAAHVRVAAD